MVNNLYFSIIEGSDSKKLDFRFVAGVAVVSGDAPGNKTEGFLLEAT